MNAQVAGRRASALCLTAPQQKKHVEAALDLGILLCADLLVEPIGRFGNLRRIAHRAD